MEGSSLDLGRLEKNTSDLYSQPMKSSAREAVSKANLAISHQAISHQAIYSEPEDPPDHGQKQIESYQQSAQRKRLAIGFGIGGGVMFAGLVLGLVAFLVTRAIAPPPTTLAPEVSTEPILSYEQLQRVDCIPEAAGGVVEATEELCVERGCIWNPSPFDGVPPCYTPQGDGVGYKVIGTEGTALGQRWFLERLTDNGIFGENFEFLTFDVEMRDDETIRFKLDVTDDTSRYKVPITLHLGDTPARNPRYELLVYKEEPFAFRVIRKSSGAILWDSGINGIIFTDKYLQISTLLPSTNIYGFGENLHRSFRHDMNWRSWPLFTRDQPPFSGDDGLDFNLYSVHPFYECVEDNGQTHGVFLLNSNAMEYTLTPAPMLLYRTIGGILDFYMFMGPSPENVIQQYTAAIGRPYMPPYWGLGFQLSRYGYKNLTELQEAVSRTIDHNIPMDVQYADIDYMDERRDFTLDHANFGGLPQYFDEIRSNGINTIIILDPPFEVNNTYEPYVNGRAIDGFVEWPDRASMPEGDYDEYNRTDMMGYVWPPWKVVFPDFFDADMTELWKEQIIKLRDLVPFDGLWLDMNEPANFDTNNDKAWNWPENLLPYWTLKCPTSEWDDPPYRTKAAYMYDNAQESKTERLSAKTLCMVGVHSGGYRHYDVHSIYGHKQTSATLGPLREAVGENKRSLVVTRSTFAGDGAISGRWLGDNSASWLDMKLSIIGMLESNLFGIPYIGADICGFFDTPSPELCMRWHELGAFYPYARNHNHKDPPPQDPGAFGEAVAGPARAALTTRYTLLPYLYTLFHKAHTRGNTVVRPLFHEFSTDMDTWSIDEQFLWGPALLISPIIEENPENHTFYLPRGKWYDYYTKVSISDSGQELIYMTGIDTATPIPLHVRGGYILPTQEPANNTRYSRQNTFGLLVALDEVDGFAEGDLFWDDGESIDTYESGTYHYTYFKCYERRLHMRVQYSAGVPEMTYLYLDTVHVMGVSSAGIVYVDDQVIETFTYDGDKELLSVTGLNKSMADDFFIEWRDKRYPTEAESLRVDCCPEGCVDFECTAKNCLWNPVADVDGVPACFINQAEYGYKITTIGSVFHQLEWKGHSSMFGGDIQDISISGQSYGNIFQIRIIDRNQARFEVPLPLRLRGDPGNFDYEYNTNPFGFRIGRAGTTMEILDTYDLNGLTYTDKYLQLSARVASKNIYGLGEHMKSTFKHGFNYKTWPMFSRDQPPAEGANLYSVQPFFICIEDSNRAHGVLFLNSNAQEIMFHPTPALTYRTTGGVIDILVIIGNSPEQVIQRYTQMIGYPYMPPYWSLGFHLSRYGYTHIDEMEAAVTRTKEAGIPLEALHLDIDVFDERKVFTIDKTNFSTLPELFVKLHNESMKLVMILNPTVVTNETGYRPYDEGLQREAFVMWQAGLSPDYDINNNNVLLGWVWPKGRVAFFDYFKSDAANLWKELIIDYHRSGVDFDAVWLDMGEPANFGTNQDRAFNWPEDDIPYWTLKCPRTEWDDPPYKPGSVWGDRLSDKTICMSALHNSNATRHYDVHSLYGWHQTVPTVEALQTATMNRSLVITRATFPGTGRSAGHWLGDNASVWKALKQSIVGILDFNLFGIPYVGADICGYFGDAVADMCERWHQLGAFYPFARNHNGASGVDQDPVAMGGTVPASTKRVLETRYSLLPYLYTLFYHAHDSGNTVVRPLHHEFTSNRETLDIDEQFMWGKALLISPVIRQDKTEIYGYIPTGRWFDFYTGVEMAPTGQVVLMNAPHDHIPLHVRGGNIIPMQAPALSTTYSRALPFSLLVAPDTSQRASGTLFWDDGDGIGTIGDDRFCFVDLSMRSNNVSYTVHAKSNDMVGVVLDTIRILGVPLAPTEITTSPSSDTLTYTYSPIKHELSVDNLGLVMNQNISLWWI